MNTSLNWIKAMVPGLECTDQEFRDAMTLSGTKVECFNAFDKLSLIHISEPTRRS